MEFLCGKNRQGDDMTDKELKHMSRADLIEIISQYQNREREQSETIKQLSAQLNERRTHIKNAGSIAEAALSVHHIFETAQAAADDFLAEVRAANADKEAQGRMILESARAEADTIRAQAREEARGMTENARRECDAMYSQITKLLKNYEELRSLLPGRITSNQESSYGKI